MPVVLWLAVMFFFSTDAFSSGQTSRIIVPLLQFFFPGLSPDALDMWHSVVRKSGHVSEYFILAVLAYRAFKYEQADLTRARIRAAAFVLLAALLDEFHQAFTASRSASIVDVGYDCLGAVLAHG
jgi:VanZ family protein